MEENRGGGRKGERGERREEKEGGRKERVREREEEGGGGRGGESSLSTYRIGEGHLALHL